MHPVLFQIGDFSFKTHGLLAVIGIISGAIVSYFLAKKKLDCSLLFDNLIYAILAGIIGARLTYYFLYREQFSQIKEIFFLWNGGMVSYGGFFLGAIALVWLLKKQKQPVLAWFDVLAVALPLGMFFGRLGNVAAGENFGVANTSFISLNGQFPTTLIEGIYDLVVFIFLLFLSTRKTTNNPPGLILTLSILLYTSGRFIIDFWRDEADVLSILSIGQITSLALALAALTGLLIITFKRKAQGDVT